MATAIAVEQAYASRFWGNDPDIDYENRMVAIASISFINEDADTRQFRQHVAAHEGRFVDSAWPVILIVFPNLVAALACLRPVHKRLGRRVRSGINLAEFVASSGGGPGGGSKFALALMEQSEPGGMSFSAVVEDRITSRVRALDIGREEPASWRLKVFFVIQLSAILAYFLGWYYGIYWKIGQIVEHGSYQCWPEWLCH